MSGERRRRHRGRPNRSGGLLGGIVLATVAALALSLVGVLVWAAVFNQHESKGPEAPTGTTPHAGHSATQATSARQAASPSPLLAQADPVTACIAEVQAADAEVAAAAVGIGHWAEHIKARTDLLSGAQPKEVTKAIWKRTREAGPADLTRYDRAVAEHKRSTGACDRAVKDGDGQQLATCLQRLRVLQNAVTTGAAGMADWRAHQAAMAAHKAGEIDAAHAQTMWVAAWAAAPKNINAFKTASAAVATAPACRS